FGLVSACTLVINYLFSGLDTVSSLLQRFGSVELGCWPQSEPRLGYSRGRPNHHCGIALCSRKGPFRDFGQINVTPLSNRSLVSNPLIGSAWCHASRNDILTHVRLAPSSPWDHARKAA